MRLALCVLMVLLKVQLSRDVGDRHADGNKSKRNTSNSRSGLSAFMRCREDDPGMEPSASCPATLNEGAACGNFSQHLHQLRRRFLWSGSRLHQT
jgi:hypothetical protein